ncbi:MAG: metallophosphoesterase [Lachnospiraceae bacterium]|nr:metallophosphoesterase [Lachnospiraceae bacterium]
MKKLRLAMTAMLLASAVSVLTGIDGQAAEKKEVSINAEKKTMYVGNTYTLKLKNITLEEDEELKWKSTNEKVVEIRKEKKDKVVIEAKKKGTAVVRVKYQDEVYRCKVTVKKQSISAASMIVDRGDIEAVAFRGKKTKTKSTVVKWNKIESKKSTDTKIFWAVKNPSVISLSKKNNSTVKIKVKKEGNTVIRAKYKGKTYQCKVITKDPKLDYVNAPLEVKKTKTIAFKGKRTTTKTKIVNWNKILIQPNTQNTIYWAVENAGIASISKKNSTTIKVKGEKLGTTYVRVKYRGKLYQCRIKVVIPSYWEKELNQSAQSVQIKEQIYGSMAKFIFLTDSHWKANAQKSPALISSLSKRLSIPYTIFGGDAITSHHDTQESAIAELKDFYAQFDGKLLSTTGNHDWNTENNMNVLSYLSESQLYDLMYQKQTSFAVTENNGKCAYIDDPDHKIRYISFYFDTRLDIEPYVSLWVDQHIEELPEGWTVMLFSHAYYKASKLGAAENTIPGAKEYADHLLELQSMVKADVAAWMVGHCHRNLSSLLTYQGENGDGTPIVTEEPAVPVTGGAVNEDSSEVQPDQPKKDSSLLVVSTNCDTYKQSIQWGGDNMTLGTSTEQAFEIVQIDTMRHQLYLTRVGAGEDRSLSY